MRAEIRPRIGGSRSVEAGGGLRSAGSHDPGGAAREQHPDEHPRADRADDAAGTAQRDGSVGSDGSAVHREDRSIASISPCSEVICVGRQDEQHGEDRHRVHEHLRDPGPPDRGRDVAAGIDHLLACGRRQLDPDERVQQHRHDRDEDGVGRREIAGADAVHAVLDAVRRDADGEEHEQRDLADRTARRHPLAVAAAGRPRPTVATPTNTAPNTYVPGRAQVGEEALEHGDRDDGHRAAEPHRRPGPVQQRRQRPREAAERVPHPDVRAALVRDRRAQLGARQRRGHEEGDQRARSAR